MLDSLRRSNPQRLAHATLMLLAGAAVLFAAGILFAFASVTSASRDVNDDAGLAIGSNKAVSLLASSGGTLRDIRSALRWSPAVQTLPVAQRQTIEAAIADSNIAPETMPAEVRGIDAPVSATQAVAIQRTTDEVQRLFAAETAAMPGQIAGDLSASLARLQASLTTYFAEPNLLNLVTAIGETEAAESLFVTLSQMGADDVATQQSLVADHISTARIALAAGLATVVLAALIAVLVIGPRARRAQRLIEQERAEQLKTTESLTYRNNQLSALYSVVSEITETLSVRYVVDTALHQVLSLIGASSAAMRLLRGDDLVLVGSLRDNGEEVPGLRQIKVGQGIVGRAVKRGRTIRVDEGAANATTQNVPLAERAESGIVVPLIVGARIVGVLSCFSTRRSAFTAEDERILEMMASQVATAVVAADSTEVHEKQAMQDPLTGLPNRRQLAQDIEDDLSQLVADGKSAVVAMADVDHFKRLNDEFGHRVGDVTLQKVAAALRTSVREEDRVYRYGGEEFVVVFTNTAKAEALQLAERMRNTVATLPLTGDNLQPVGPVTISIGLASVPEDGSDFEAVIGRADEALYCAKDGGRNRVELWKADSARADELAVA